MSNLIYTDEIYNKYQKERFIKTQDQITGKLIGILFKKSAALENQLQKDLFDFNLPEIELALKRMRAGTINSASNYVSMIKNYINWAISQDLRNTNEINPLVTEAETNTEYYEKFVDATKDKKLFAEDTIDEIISSCVNDQDAVIVRLLFEVGGGDGLEEILNLTSNDIDVESRILTLRNGKGGERKVEVSQQLINLCLRAMKEEEYQKRNGNSNAKAKTLKLVKNNYVIKTAQTRNLDEGRSDKHTIYRRLTVLNEELGYPYLQATNLRDSGMLKFLWEQYKKNNGVLTKEDYYVVCERFDITKVVINHAEKEYNYYPYKSAFLNEETIKSIYGDENGSL